MADALRYGCASGQSPHNAHRHLIDMVGTGKRVLDVGCASGYLSEKLTAQGCRVVGLEVDPEAAQRARPYCERVVVGSAEDRAALASCGSGFDVILCGDVLEHLSDPASPVRAFRDMLAPGGSLLVSLPNIANVKIRLSLLFGRFEYTEAGILDRTHLRFFTLASGRRFFRDNGWKFRPCVGRMPYALARAWPSLLAPQFAFRLVPDHA